MYVDSSMVANARSADLYSFLLSRHPGQFRPEGASLRMVGRGGISIKRGYYGYKDFSSGESGNGIDFLMKYLGYAFQDAVLALAGACPAATAACAGSPAAAAPSGSRRLRFPNPAPLPHSGMFAFLMGRGIPRHVIADLSAKGLIYQSVPGNNVVFVSKEHDYCEIRGTFTFTEKPFHGCRKSRPDRFWYFTGGISKPCVAYVTEAAIDAISLWILHKRGGLDTSDAVYISVGGASNHLAIERIKKGIRTILAVDNDNAGKACREHHTDLDYILPVHKDWNEDLQHSCRG